VAAQEATAACDETAALGGCPAARRRHRKNRTQHSTAKFQRGYVRSHSVTRRNNVFLKQFNPLQKKCLN
jgi:hypothetical protein